MECGKLSPKGPRIRCCCCWTYLTLQACSDLHCACRLSLKGLSTGRTITGALRVSSPGNPLSAAWRPAPAADGARSAADAAAQASGRAALHTGDEGAEAAASSAGLAQDSTAVSAGNGAGAGTGGAWGAQSRGGEQGRARLLGPGGDVGSLSGEWGGT
jgi:hypothetical protein